MNAKTEAKTTMYKWTACNPYNYLNGVVEARTLLGAVRAGRKYVEDELGGEGEIRIWESIDGGRTWKLVRTDEKGIFSVTGWAVRHE